jgi:GTPase SAR1 family protein
MPQQPYISRPEAEEFIAILRKAFSKPSESPVVFHIWGIGGVGKSTLLRQIAKDLSDTALPLVGQMPISFGDTEGIEESIALMCKFHRLLQPQFLNLGLWSRGLGQRKDTFLNLYTQYFDAIYKLKTETPDGQSAVSPEPG